MVEAARPRRYPKGEVRRGEILRAALALIAERGYSASSLQEIADAVGITKAGVLHYFPSREALIAAVLEERDAESLAHYHEAFPDADPADIVGILLQASAHSFETPGLVALYSRLVVDAAGPEHPAHAYIHDRYDVTVGALAAVVRRNDIQLPGGLDPETFARIVVAASDGLQLQWSYRPEIDMRDTLERAIRVLSGGALPLPGSTREAETVAEAERVARGETLPDIGTGADDDPIAEVGPAVHA